MAALLIATPFVHSNALRSNARIANVRGFQGQKTLRMVCPRASISGAQRSDASKIGVRQTGVTVLQSLSSPLLNLSPADLIAAFLEEAIDEEAQLNLSPAALITSFLEEETHEEEEAQRVEVAQPLKKVEPVLEVQQVVRRRSGPVVFTEEKARRMRQENRATQTFHDKWYHSAIASRLAAPESRVDMPS